MPAHTILIADDEPYITYMLASRLTEREMNVMTATNGEEALAMAIASPPRVIVTDFQMPRMSGLDLARALKGRPETAAIPIVMLTARGHKLTPTELRETSIQHLMFKPFSARELVALLDEYLDPDRAATAPERVLDPFRAIRRREAA